MSVLRWFERKRAKALTVRREGKESSTIACDSCRVGHLEQDLRANQCLCPSCEHHYYMPVQDRIALLIDAETWESWSGSISPVDSLGFAARKAYIDKLTAHQERSGRPDAIEAGGGEIYGERVALVVMDYSFIGGSMGAVVGEELARAAERAAEEERSLVVVTASGGARMQEGALSLMQMAKTTVALEALTDMRLPYISVLTNPTTGGVTASFATLGDVIIAEPKALIGFAGPRVVQQTLRQDLPEGFQRAEFLMERGMLDAIVVRHRLKEQIAAYLKLLRGGVANAPALQATTRSVATVQLEGSGTQ